MTPAAQPVLLSGTPPRPLASAAVLLFALTVSMHAQGILTVTPSRTASTTAGTAPQATLATLARPPPRR
jgi:hypothetical protein